MAALRVVLLAGCALSHAGVAHARQTQWQRSLLGRVRESARIASERATSEFLQRLGSEELRAQLAACCPSARNLTTRQLLDRLQADMAVAEVVSAFPAVQDVTEILPDTPGMSVADGLAGSFFQNGWQSVLHHSKNPGSVFRRVVGDYRIAVCNMDSRTVKMETWAAPGCNGPLVSNKTYPQDRCLHDATDRFTIQFVCRGGRARMHFWLDQQQLPRRRGPRRSWQSPPNMSGTTALAACPDRPADYSQAYKADGACHDYVQQNCSQGWLIEDHAEVRSYGLRPFGSAGNPQTLAEAAERGPYAAVNLLLLDAGSPLYGDVSAVFSLSAMRESALISAVDTGFYQVQCAGDAGDWPFSKHGNEQNCSAYTPLSQLGTMDHFNHLFMMNERFWPETSTLAMRFARAEGEWGQHEIVTRHLLKYFEVIPAATLQYPDDVRFLIASFPSLFGTEVGMQLQQWARQRGWLLVWSLGFNLDGVGVGMEFSVLLMNYSLRANQRLVDPIVALETTAAASLPLASATRPFLDYWARAAALGNYSVESRADNATWALLWGGLADALPALRVRPLRGGDCPRPLDAPECVGVSLDGRCVCYGKGSAHEQLLV